MAARLDVRVEKKHDVIIPQEDLTKAEVWEATGIELDDDDIRIAADLAGMELEGKEVNFFKMLKACLQREQEEAQQDAQGEHTVVLAVDDPTSLDARDNLDESRLQMMAK